MAGLKTKFGILFAAHQLIAQWVVTVSVPVLLASSLIVLHRMGLQGYQSDFHWLLSGTPYFPAHAALALALGMILTLALRDRSSLWVWTVPTAWMTYALIAVATLTPDRVPSAFQAGSGQSPWTHYFGAGCQAGGYCLDQTTFTRPFLIGIAYSTGGALAAAVGNRSERRLQSLLLIILGGFFVTGAVYDTLRSVRVEGWQESLLVLESVPLAMGLFLLVLGCATWKGIHFNGLRQESADARTAEAPPS